MYRRKVLRKSAGSSPKCWPLDSLLGFFSPRPGPWILPFWILDVCPVGTRQQACIGHARGGLTCGPAGLSPRPVSRLRAWRMAGLLGPPGAVGARRFAIDSRDAERHQGATRGGERRAREPVAAVAAEVTLGALFGEIAAERSRRRAAARETRAGLPPQASSSA